MSILLQVYKTGFFTSIERIRKDRKERLLDEERWAESWSNSIQKIKSLY